MGKCKLYIQAGKNNTYIGEFSSREAAEKYYEAIKGEVQSRYDYTVQAKPVYIEKGRGK